MNPQKAAEKAKKAALRLHGHSPHVPGTCTCGYEGQGIVPKRSVGLHVQAAVRSAIREDALRRRQR